MAKLPIPFNNPATYPGHTGVDFPKPLGTPIPASGPGRVGLLSRNARAGYMCWVDYDNGTPGVASAHLPNHNACPPVGTRTALGMKIGEVGSTGNSTGPHLHQEVNGYGSTDGYWRWFDRNVVVGATPAGGSSGSSGGAWPARDLYGEAWVVAAQGKLRAFGLYAGELDGKDGAQTQAATSELQGIGGLGVDGIFGPATNAFADQLLDGRNATDRLTADIQRLVGADPDGIWGPKTSLRVYLWQKANGLTADAVWGPASDAKGFASLEVGRNVTARPTAEVQAFLISKGYDLGQWGADGDYGAATTAAVRQFQAANGLKADGIWGLDTDTVAFPPVSVRDWPVNGYNATQRPTRDIQSFIISQGFSVGPMGADGDYGPATSIGVAQWQDKHGLSVDGVWGPQSDAKAFPGQPVDPAPGITTRTPTYPGASKALNVPLGDGARTAGSVINRLIVHHTATTADQERYFSQANDRGSCPTFYVRTSGEVLELVEPSKRPASTGSANTYSIAIETQNLTGAPEWGVTATSIEAIAGIAAWLHSLDGKSIGGVPVAFKLDRTHLIGHNEAGVNATACPGPMLSAKLAAIVARAKEIYAEKYVEPDPEPDTVPVERTWLQGVLDKLKSLLGGR